MTYTNLILPPRMLVVLSVYKSLKENSSEHTYEVKPNKFLMDQYPNMVVIPVIYMMPMWTDITTIFIITNLSMKPIFLAKCKILGFLNHVYTKFVI